MKNDERAFKQRKLSEESIDEYDNYDGIGTNIVNSKQLKKIRKNNTSFEFESKRYKNYYMFPDEDQYCTESQINIKYCANCGRKDHHFSNCKYDDNHLFQNYKRKSFTRDKINQNHNNERIKTHKEERRKYSDAKIHKEKEEQKISKINQKYDQRREEILERKDQNLKKREKKQQEKRLSSRDFLEIAESSSNSEHKQYDDSRENNWIDNKNSTDYEFSSLFIPKANTICAKKKKKNDFSYQINEAIRNYLKSNGNEYDSDAWVNSNISGNIKADSNLTDNLLTIGEEESDLPFYQNNDANTYSTQSNKNGNNKRKSSDHNQNWPNDSIVNNGSPNSNKKKNKKKKKNKSKKNNTQYVFN